jgi:hypothetical protein
MGGLFSNCAVILARRKARTRGARCIAILKETETHLNAMQQKYQAQLTDVNEAIAVGQALPNKSAHDKQLRKDRLVELLRKRKTLRHYLSVCRKRNNQMLAKTMAIEQLEINAMQLQAIKSTAEAFESFSRKTGGVDNIEDAADKLSEHMETLADIDGIIQESNMLPLGFNDDDDDDLLAELAQFDEEMDDEVDGETSPAKYNTESGSVAGTIGVTVADLELPTVPLVGLGKSNSTSTLKHTLSSEPIAL